MEQSFLVEVLPVVQNYPEFLPNELEREYDAELKNPSKEQTVKVSSTSPRTPSEMMQSSIRPIDLEALVQKKQRSDHRTRRHGEPTLTTLSPSYFASQSRTSSASTQASTRKSKKTREDRDSRQNLEQQKQQNLMDRRLALYKARANKSLIECASVLPGTQHETEDSAPRTARRKPSSRCGCATANPAICKTSMTIGRRSDSRSAVISSVSRTSSAERQEAGMCMITRTASAQMAVDFQSLVFH